MDVYTLLKALHIVGATVLFGTGVGIAFFMLMAHRTHDPAFVAETAGVVVVADMLFTASAGVLQPLTGAALAKLDGVSLLDGWAGLSLILYGMVGAFWLPVVWIQIRMRDLARQAVRSGQPLPEDYLRLFRVWFACGLPAFGAMVAILWLMVTKPSW